MEITIHNIKKLFLPGGYDIIKATNNLEFKNTLDIGFGSGGASLYFSAQDKNVTALGLDVNSYNYPHKLFEEYKINVIEAQLENVLFENKFDAIWASHVLEHVPNTSVFLRKCWDLLEINGWLFIMVPPYKNQVVGGHINNGWNIGQLMYNLLLNGFNIKDGHFISHGYNICAFVRKTEQVLPPLRMDNGDIETLESFWPIVVKQGFNGNINKINWFNNFESENKNIWCTEMKFSYTLLTDLFKNIALLDKSNKYILYGFGSIGKLIYPHIKFNIEYIIDNSLTSKFIDHIEVIEIHKLEELDNRNVIISPFLYHVEIEKLLEPYNCNIIYLL